MAENRYRCAACRKPEYPWGLEFASHEPKCPECGATGPAAIVELLTIHLYAPDPANGPIIGEHGRRFRVACKPNATNPNGVPCTSEANVVTCQECKKTKDYKAAMDRQQATAGGVILG